MKCTTELARELEQNNIWHSEEMYIYVNKKSAGTGGIIFYGAQFMNHFNWEYLFLSLKMLILTSF